MTPRTTGGWQAFRLLMLPAVLIVAGGFVAPLEQVIEGSDIRIVHAAKSAQWDALRVLLEQGADVTEVAGDGATALHWASHWDNLEIAELLIRAGADVNAATDLGITPLWPASLNGNAAMVRKLLEAGADPNRAHLSGETPVMTAARGGHADVVETLLAKGADLNVRATRGQTALMWAASQGHADAVEVLIRHGADVHARSDVWSELWQMLEGADVHPDYLAWMQEGGLTPLLFAARVGNLAVAKLLVAAGADVNDETAGGLSATILAVHSVTDHDGYLPESYTPGPLGGGQRASPAANPPSDGEELVEFLLVQGADPNADAAGYTALHTALLRRSERTVRVLLAHGADPNARLRVSTPVRRASHDFNFDPAFVGATPFWLAARFSQPGAMRLLAEYGADPLSEHSPEYWGRGNRERGWTRVAEGRTTALMAGVGMVRGRGYPYRQPDDRKEQEALTLEAVKVAIELGVDLNVPNAAGRTALDGATALRFDSVVKFLTEKGAVAGVAAPARAAPLRREPRP